MNETASSRRLEIHGHRGARGLLPENTLCGFAATLALGVDALELDVGISRDGVVMVHHDSTLNPLTTRNSDGEWLASTDRLPIYSLSAAQLQTYDIGMLKPGTDYAKRYAQQKPLAQARIPTLSQVIELVHRCSDPHVRLNIEAKLDPRKPTLTAPPAAFADSLIELLRASDMLARATIQSFDWRVLAAVQTRAPLIPTGFLSEQRVGATDTVTGHGKTPSPWTNGMHLDDYQGSVPRMVHAAGGTVWSPDFRSLDEGALREAHALGLRVVVWTVNDPHDIQRMIALGVDGVISDYPDRVRESAQNIGLQVAAPASLKS